MNYGEIISIVKELVVLKEDEYLDYTKQLKESLKLLNKEESELIKWVYFDKKSLKEYTELKGIT